jgi:HSP20 family protein
MLSKRRRTTPGADTGTLKNALAPLRELRSAMEGLYGELYKAHDWGDADVEPYGPAVDCYESDGRLVVEAAVPGVEKSEIFVVLDDVHLSISAPSWRRTYIDDARFIMRELPAGRCERTVLLPFEVEADEVRAHLEEGVLYVFMTPLRSPRPRQRRVPVE